MLNLASWPIIILPPKRYLNHLGPYVNGGSAPLTVEVICACLPVWWAHYPCTIPRIHLLFGCQIRYYRFQVKGRMNKTVLGWWSALRETTVVSPFWEILLRHAHAPTVGRKPKTITVYHISGVIVNGSANSLAFNFSNSICNRQR